MSGSVSTALRLTRGGDVRFDINNLDYRAGLNTGLAWDAMNSAALSLSSEIIGIVDLATAVIGVPEVQRTFILQQQFAARDGIPSAEKRLLDKCDELQTAIRDNITLAQASVDEPLDFSSAREAIRAAGQLKDAIHKLITVDDDNGAALYEYLRHNIKPEIQAFMESMRRNTPKTGRKRGLTPVNRFILEQADEIQKLHRTRSLGEVYERLMTRLRERRDVQAWQMQCAEYIGDKFDLELDKQSVEVQAFDKLQGLERVNGGAKIQSIRDNHNRASRL